MLALRAHLVEGSCADEHRAGPHEHTVDATVYSRDAWHRALTAALGPLDDAPPPSADALQLTPAGASLELPLPPLRTAVLLRARVLSGDFDVELTRALHAQPRRDDGAQLPCRALAERSSFAEAYEKGMLSLELTPHQQEALEQLEAVDSRHIHLCAPAGAGKTFVALSRLLGSLHAGDRALFASRNAALGLFVAGWIARRGGGGRARRRALVRRLRLLCTDEGAWCLYSLDVRGDSIVRTAEDNASASPADEYALAVVDEAHHLFDSAPAREAIEARVSESTRLVLLSDESQRADGRIGAVYPRATRVRLSEVIRCSQRIVAGASVFQLGGEAKLLTRCHHELSGPPLQSFLFDASAAADFNDHDADGIFGLYAEYTVRAVRHARRLFPSLELGGRLALLVPDLAFRASLEAALAGRLASREFGLRLVSAVDACSEIGPPIDAADEKDVSDDDASLVAGEDGEVDPAVGGSVLLDSVEEVEGLERLIVIAVGLDCPVPATTVSGIEGASDTAGAARAVASDAGGRSLLYRAITRAQLAFAVVNQFVPGGWLEFLGHITKEESRFEAGKAMANTAVSLVEEIVQADISESLREAMAASWPGAPPLSKEAMNHLVCEVAARRERGEDLEAGAVDVLVDWKRSHSCAKSAVSDVVPKSRHFLHLPPTAVRDLAEEVCLALLRGHAHSAEIAASEAVQRWVAREEDGLFTSHIEAAMERSQRLGEASASAGRSPTLAEWAQRAPMHCMKQKMSNLLVQGVPLDDAASAAVVDWQELRPAVLEAFARAAERVPSCPSWDEPVRIELMLDVARSAHQDADMRGERLVAAAEAKILQLKAKRTLEARRAALSEALASGSTSPLLWSASELMSDKAAESALLVLAASAADAIMPKPQRGPTVTGIITRALRSALQSRDAVDAPIADAQVAAVAIEGFRYAENVARRSLAEEAQRLQLASPPLALERATACRVAAMLDALQTLSLVGAENTIHRSLSMPAVAELLQSAATVAAQSLDEWSSTQAAADEQRSLVVAKLVEAAKARQVYLPDESSAELVRRALSAIEMGASVDAACAHALSEFEKQRVRRLVRQSVWDTSTNEGVAPSQRSGLVRFMPFRTDAADKLDFELLTSVFAHLPLNEYGKLARVCKRWRSVIRDPSWMPDNLALGWGDGADLGLDEDAPHPIPLPLASRVPIAEIVTTDGATICRTIYGRLYHWGRHWLPSEVRQEREVRPRLLDGISDVTMVRCTPAGYYHARRRTSGFSVAAVTRTGELYTWGVRLPRPEPGERDAVLIEAPSRAKGYGEADIREWERRGGSCGALDEDESSRPVRARLISVGLQHLAVAVAPAEESLPTRVLTCGTFCFGGSLESTHSIRSLPELEGLPLKAIESGAFHACALTDRGVLYTWGHEAGIDLSNGNLLGHGPPSADLTVFPLTASQPPRRVDARGLGPIAEVRCSTYSSMAITMDGRVFTWGDSDGGALGHTVTPCHSPVRVGGGLQAVRVEHGSMSYTNAAVATEDGRCFVWGGGAWEGGIAASGQSDAPAEVRGWSGIPPHYKCSAISLGQKHGYLVFAKRAGPDA